MGLPVGWEVAHEVYGVINPKVNATNPLPAAPSCPKWPPTPLPLDWGGGGGPGMTATPSATPAVTPNPGCNAQATANLNVRSTRSVSSDNIIGKLFTGQVIQVTALVDGWYQLFIANVEHWVNQQNVQIQGNCTGLSSAPVSVANSVSNIGVFCVNALMPLPDLFGYCETYIYNNTRPVYEELSVRVGHSLTLSEVMGITVIEEWWAYRSRGNIKNYGMEGFSRNLFQQCKNDGCNIVEFLWLLSGYQPWLIGNMGLNLTVEALESVYWDNMTQLNNSNSELSQAVASILFPIDVSWSSGYDGYRSWQWFTQLTTATRPTQGSDPCNQILLRDTPISFEMYTGFQDAALNGRYTCP
jgi:hypothetical protein